MANRDGGVLLQQQHGHGFAHDIAAANNDSVFAAQVIANGFEHLHAAIRRAGYKAWLAHHQSTGACDVESIDIFFGRDGFNDFVGIDVFRYRQLHQNAVDGGVFVERVNARQQSRFGHICVMALEHRMQACIGTGLDLVTHIHL